MLSVAQSVYYQMVQWLVNDELERIQKEAVIIIIIIIY
jgi:hypothetical protein